MISLLFIAMGGAAALAIAVAAWITWGGDDPSTPEMEALLTMNGLWIPAERQPDDAEARR